MKRERDADDDADQTGSPIKKAHTSEPVVPEPPGSGSAAIQGENLEPAPIRDKEYYDQEGDLIIRVERTLFKVHRFALRDSKVFRSIVKPPLECDRSGSMTSIGCCDDHPMVLQGETVEAFKLLLEVQHALPGTSMARADHLKRRQGIDSLVSLLEDTRKYQFESTGEMVLDLLTEYLKKFTGHLNKTASASLLKRTIEVLSAQESWKLQDAFSRIFATRVFDKAFPPRIGLKFADTHNLPLVQGAVYYALTFYTASNDRKLEPQKFEVGGADTRLQYRLLHGYWSLMHYSQVLAVTPPLSAEKCQALKISKWHRLYTTKYKPALSHPLAMLEECKRGLMAVVDAPATGVAPDRVLVAAEMDKFIQKFCDGVIEHYEPSN